MPDTHFHHPAASPAGAWETFWLPFLVSVALFLVDFYLIPGIFALPLLLLILLLFLAFRLPARAVAAWTAVFALAILILLFLPAPQSSTTPVLKPYIRTALFLAGGSGAVLLAAYRRRLEAGHEALFRIISGLPLPVIVSDISGNILLLNEQARQVLKHHVDELTGRSYFSAFVSADGREKTIAAYTDYFDPHHVIPVAAALRTRTAPALCLHAAITVVPIGKHRYAITMVERVEAIAET